MSEPRDHRYRYVTNAELDEKLDEKPSRWEVRFLVLAGFLGSQAMSTFLPMREAVAALRGIF